MRALLLVVAVCCSLMLPSCFGCDRLVQKATETAAEKAVESASGGKADVDFSDGKFSIETEDGSSSHQIGDDAQVPDGWPGEFPQYPGSQITSAHRTTDKDYVLMGFTMTTPDSVDEVIAFYAGKAAAAGYSSKARFSADGGSTEMFESPEYILSVNVAGSENGNMVALSLQTNEANSGASAAGSPPEESGGAESAGDQEAGESDGGGGGETGSGGGDDGATVVYDTTGQIPEGFPVDVLKPYGDAQVTAASMANGNSTLVQVTSDSRKQVAKFYDDHFTALGWTIDSQVEIPATTMHGYKGSNGEIFMSAGDVPGKVQITLSYSEK